MTPVAWIKLRAMKNASARGSVLLVNVFQKQRDSWYYLAFIARSIWWVMVELVQRNFNRQQKECRPWLHWCRMLLCKTWAKCNDHKLEESVNDYFSQTCAHQSTGDSELNCELVPSSGSFCAHKSKTMPWQSFWNTVHFTEQYVEVHTEQYMELPWMNVL